MEATESNIKIDLKELGLLFLVLLSIHFTEFKIGVVKLSEILLLLLPPVIYTRKTNKWIVSFYLLFFVWLVLSLLLNPFRELPVLQDVSSLKKPYLITIGRFLELVACINLVALVRHYFKNKTTFYLRSFVKKVVYISFFLVLSNALLFVLLIKGVIGETEVVHFTTSNYYRLRGWFVEGGPYGLMLSFIFVLSFLYSSKYNLFIRSFFLVVIVVFARSKAGVLLLVLWGVIYYYKTIYRKIRSLGVIVLITGGIIAAFALTKLAEVYIEHIKNMEEYVLQRPTDTNLIMGRIAGSHIVPRMVMDNPVFGIGLGNYPIVRNVETYRKFIPYSPDGKTDAHGLGGIVQLLVDGGLVVLFIFMAIIIQLIRKSVLLKNNLEGYLFAFICFFLSGVQIYFLYPWFLLGLIISLNEKSEERT